MSLQTEMMRQTDQRVIHTFKRPSGKWSAIEWVNHPSPSGNERWMPTYEDKREWPDKETAKAEFEKLLK